jgi:hypothetical protein
VKKRIILTTIPPINTPKANQSKGPRNNSYRLMGSSSFAKGYHRSP